MALFKKKKTDDTQYEDVVSNLLTCKSNVNDIHQTVTIFLKNNCSNFKCNKNEFTFTLNDGSEAKIVLETNDEVVNNLTSDLVSSYSNENNRSNILSSVVKQIGMFDTLLVFNYKIPLGNVPHIPFVEQLLYKMASALGAYVLFSNMCLYTSEGKLLMSLDGDSTYESFFPLDYDGLKLYDASLESDDDAARRELSLMRLSQKGLSYIPNFAVEDTSSAILRDLEDVLKVCAINYLLASRNYCETNGFTNVDQMMENEYKVLKFTYNLNDTDLEESIDYILNGGDTTIYYQDKLEYIAALLWAFNVFNVGDFNELVKFDSIKKVIFERSIDDIGTKTIRNINSILKEIDYYMRLDWAANSVIKNEIESLELNHTVITNRYKALKWICSLD